MEMLFYGLTYVKIISFQSSIKLFTNVFIVSHKKKKCITIFRILKNKNMFKCYKSMQVNI